MPKEQLYKKYAKFYSKKKYDKEVAFIKSIVSNFKVKGKKIIFVPTVSEIESYKGYIEDGE